MSSFSRDTFDKLKHYVGVRLQQGVPLVDADWNEQEDIRKYELQAFLKWFVGNGVPEGNDGFCIEAIPADNDFDIKGGDGTAEGAGRCLVEGWDAINESNLKYTAQPLFDNAALAAKWGVDPVQRLTTPTDRTDTIYLDLWEREVDAEEDYEHLVNPKIGIETCVRLKREWAVRVAEETTTPPEPPQGHVFYPLAHLRREGGEAMIENITDLRTTSLNMAALEAEIVDARGLKGNIGNRLDESLTREGQLLHDVVGNDQVKADAAIEEKKILFSPTGHDHDGIDGEKISPTNLLQVNSTVTANNLNVLTGGTSSNASNLHYHPEIPMQTQKYTVPFPLLKYLTHQEFISTYMHVRCPAHIKCWGFAPIFLPRYCVAKKVGVYTRNDDDTTFDLWVKLLYSSHDSDSGYIPMTLRITSPGYKETTFSHPINPDCSYIVFVYMEEAQQIVYLNGIFIEYEISKLF